MVFYVQLDKRFVSVAAENVSKKKCIEATVLNSFTPLSKSDICSILPDVSPTTVAFHPRGFQIGEVGLMFADKSYPG